MPDFVGAEGTSIKVQPHPLFGGFGPGVALALLARPTRPKIDLFFDSHVRTGAVALEQHVDECRTRAGLGAST